MKNILIFLFICFGFALNSQITITCYECKKNTTVDCKGCNIQSNLFTGIVIKEKGKPDIPLYEPYKVSNKSSVFTFEDAFGTKTIVNVTSVLNYNTPKKLYDYLSNCLCKPSTIDTDTDRYSVLIQDSILVTYDINGVEIDRDTIRLFDIDTDTKTFLVQDSILVYYDIQNNEIGRDTIKIPFVDTDIQTYLTQDSILVYYDESNTEIDRDTIDIPNITEQGNFRISNDTLYHNNSIDGIEQFVKLPTLDTTTQSYLPILNGLDTIGYENIMYLGGVEVDRDTITLPLHKNQVQSNDTQTAPYTGVELPTLAGVNTGDTKSVKFNDGTVVNYTWNGAWVKDFVEEPFNPIDETTCTTFDEKILVEKLDGTIVTRPANSIKRNEVFPAGNYTVLPTDEIIYAVGGSTITLQGCTTCKEKTIYRDACSDGLITILPPSGQTIDGVHTSRVLQVGRGAFTYECVDGKWRIKSEFFETDQSCASFSVINTPSASVQVYTLDGLPYSVDWGDGTNSGLIASGLQSSKAYASNFTGSIKICKTCGVSPIFQVNFDSGNWNFDINDLNQFPNLTRVDINSGITFGDIANLPSGLTYYFNTGQNATSGDIANLPSTLNVYHNGGQNTTSGDIANLPSGLTYYFNEGQNTTSGDIANLPSGLTYYYNTGQNATSGDIANLPSTLNVYHNGGQNTTSGDIANLPSGLTYYNNSGQNTTSGGIANLPSGLTYYSNIGQNTTSGDIANLPSGLTYYYNEGQNTTSGDIANLPSGLTYYFNTGQNATSGDIANLPSTLNVYHNGGQNTTSGDIANLPSGLTYYFNEGQNTVSDYSGGNLNSGITNFYSVTASGGLSSAEVDALLIELASTVPGLGYVNITGTNAPPTPASSTAITTLTGSGATVITN
jgi:hypothetical protein